MLITKCDRCGSIQEKHKYKLKVNNSDFITPVYDLDLCDECFHTINKVIKKKE